MEPPKKQTNSEKKKLNAYKITKRKRRLEREKLQKEGKEPIITTRTIDDDRVISPEDRVMLKKAYYTDGYTFGRDALFHYMKKEYPDKHPSRRTIAKYLSNQKLHQEYGQTRTGGTTNYFRPISPLHSLSIDLIDFNFKKGTGNKRYILVVVDNFSRKMWTVALTGKSPKTTRDGMANIFEQIKNDKQLIINEGDGDVTKKIKYVLTDDGSEFKNVFDELLKSKGIKRHRTLGGSPQQNGLVERQNGKIKMLMAKLMRINGRGWVEHYKKATNIVNKQVIRTTGMTPNEAMELKPDMYSKLLDNVARNQNDDVVVVKELFKVGDEVRLKKAKGVLSKASTPSWSDKIYKVGRVVTNPNPQIADSYKIVGRAQDQSYSRNDLQKIIISEGIPRLEGMTKLQLKRINEQEQKNIRDDPNAIAEGAFTQKVLDRQQEEQDAKYPDNFEKGEAAMQKQYKKLQDEEDEMEKRPTRARKQVKRLDPSLNPSDTVLRGKTKVDPNKEYVIDRLLDKRKTKTGNEFLVKWRDSDNTQWEPSWEVEYRPKPGSKGKTERNIPLEFIAELKRELKLLKTKKLEVKTLTPRKIKNVELTTKPKRRPRKLDM